MRISETFYGLKAVVLDAKSCPTCGQTQKKFTINPFRIVRTIVGLSIVSLIGLGIVEPVSDIRWISSIAVGLLLVDLKLFTAFRKGNG